MRSVCAPFVRHSLVLSSFACVVGKLEFVTPIIAYRGRYYDSCSRRPCVTSAAFIAIAGNS